MKTLTISLSLSALLLSANLWADVSHDHAHDHEHVSPAGVAGTEAQVSRTIEVIALDNMRFEHVPLRVDEGETIAFEITNQGALVHEFAIGVVEEHLEHQIMMREMPDMHHDDPNVVTLQPGETKRLIWTFANAASIEVACNIPGHYEAGMHSPVEVK